MQDHFQVLEDLEVEQVFQLQVVTLLVDAVLGLLPELIWDVIISEARAVEHQDLEEVFYAKSELVSLDLEIALLLWIT